MKNPNSLKFYRLAIDQYKKKNFDDAINNIEKALEYEPKNYQALHAKGLCYNKLGDSQKELESYKKAIAVDPSSKTAWYNAGNVFFNHGDYEMAISYYDKAIQIDEGFKDAWYNKAAALKNLDQDFEAQYAIAKAAR